LAQLRRRDRGRIAARARALFARRRGLALAVIVAALGSGAALAYVARPERHAPASSPVAASTAPAAPPPSASASPPPVAPADPAVAAPATEPSARTAPSTDPSSVEKTPARRVQKVAPRLNDRSRFGERL
jgi:hypothetical protein